MIGVKHPKWDERPIVVAVKKPGAGGLARGAAQVLRGQDRQVVDARRRGVRRRAAAHRDRQALQAHAAPADEGLQAPRLMAEVGRHAGRCDPRHERRAARPAPPRRLARRRAARAMPPTRCSSALFAAAGTRAGRGGRWPTPSAALAPLGASSTPRSRRGWSLRLRDPGIVVAQCVAGVLMQFAVAFAAPQVAFLWLANLFTVLAFSHGLALGARVDRRLARCASASAPRCFFGAQAPIAAPRASAGRDHARVALLLRSSSARCVFLERLLAARCARTSARAGASSPSRSSRSRSSSATTS